MTPRQIRAAANIPWEEAEKPYGCACGPGRPHGSSSACSAYNALGDKACVHFGATTPWCPRCGRYLRARLS